MEERCERGCVLSVGTVSLCEHAFFKVRPPFVQYSRVRDLITLAPAFSFF